jgi:hypothetical protein
VNQPAPAIPLLKVNEEQLVKMRSRLEELFRNLSLIHDLIIVCAEAVEYMGDHGTELHHCLQQLGANELYSQLRALTNTIEQLGGKTAFTEQEAATRAIQAQAGAEAAPQEDIAHA